MNDRMAHGHGKILAMTTGFLKGLVCCLISENLPSSTQASLETEWPEPPEGVVTYSAGKKYLRDTMVKCIEILDRAEAT